MALCQLLFMVLMWNTLLAEPIELFSCTFTTDMCSMDYGGESSFVWEVIRERANVDGFQRAPDHDVTTPNVRGNYLYARGGDLNSQGSMSTTFFSDTAKVCFSFWYAQGSIATLETYSGGNSTQVVWKADNPATEVGSFLWTYVSISVDKKPDYPCQLEFIVRKITLDATLALDDLLLTNGPCRTEVNSSFHCSFDDGKLCGMEQPSLTDHFDWSWVQGSTPSANTGPKYASGLEESYVYTEAHRLAASDRTALTAILETPTIIPVFVRYCLWYDYHMWGSDIGSLEVFVTNSYEQRYLSKLTGNQGNQWHTAMIDFDAPNDCKIEFYGQLSNASELTNPNGDIALDNVNVLPYECQGVGNFTESFEDNEVSVLINLKSDYNFTIRPSSPSGGKRHLAVEARSPVVENSTARLASPRLLLDSGNDSCLEITYILQDSDKALLRVGRTDFKMEGSPTWLWMTGTNGGPDPHKVALDVSSESDGTVRLIFEAFAEAGGSFGNLSIEEVQLHPNACIRHENSTSRSPSTDVISTMTTPSDVITSTTPTPDPTVATTVSLPTSTSTTPAIFTTPTPAASSTTTTPADVITSTTPTPPPTVATTVPLPTTTTTTTPAISTTAALRATTSKLDPPRLSMRARQQGASRQFQHAGRSLPFTYAEIFFQLNIPNSGGYTEMKLERCVLHPAGGRATSVVNNGCAWHPAGVLMFDGPKPGTELLYVRVFQPPASVFNFTLLCNVRLCKATDFTCFGRPTCFTKRHTRSAAFVRSFRNVPGADQGSSSRDVSADSSFGGGHRIPWDLKTGVRRAWNLHQVTTSSQVHDGNLIDVTLSFR